MNTNIQQLLLKPYLLSINYLDRKFNYLNSLSKAYEIQGEKIFSPQINESNCKDIAKVFNDLVIKYGKDLFYDLYYTGTLSAEEICKLRYFSANQDFRGSREFSQLIIIYQTDPTIFDKERIYKSPEDFLKHIGITSLSQNDKRVKYAVTASRILIDENIEPYNLFEHFNNDLLKIKMFLLANPGSGFGNKKIDMFIRDMVVLKVWKNPKNFDKINVASNINTTKVALRSGILQTSIPLISSFLDIFCYQYGLIDNTNAQAWRRVWEIWKEDFPKTCIESPSLIDYLVYRVIGKEFCKEKLCEFECESKKHKFKWHSGRNKTCQICKERKAYVISKVLPCSDVDGHLVIEKIEYVSGKDAILKGIKECPFVTVCKPKETSFKKLNPPKSISILGQTGWDSARVLSGEGGGGLMS
ncbi:MAG TPA: hypothetical protein VIK14_13285 [Ignavibacteria bacterium]